MKNNSYYYCHYCTRTMLSRYKKRHLCSRDGSIAQLKEKIAEPGNWTIKNWGVTK